MCYNKKSYCYVHFNLKCTYHYTIFNVYWGHVKICFYSANGVHKAPIPFTTRSLK